VRLAEDDSRLLRKTLQKPVKFCVSFFSPRTPPSSLHSIRRINPGQRRIVANPFDEQCFAPALPGGGLRKVGR